MPTYLIKLYPVGRFYFGGDQTFGENNEDNYFVRSIYFPQQTTLLGMIRYYLLAQNNLLGQNSGNSLIGNFGFNPEASEPKPFGIIDNLSPVFITGPDGEYFVQSREYGLNWKEDEITGEKRQELDTLKLRQKKGHCSFSKDEINYFKGLTAKTEIPDLLVNTRNGRVRFFEYSRFREDDPLNGIFVPHEQVGIKKPGMREGIKTENKKGFYKQIGYTFPPGYGFAFYASFQSAPKNFTDGLVKMGADQSWFRIEIIGETAPVGYYSFESLTANLFCNINDPEEKVVLLSDAYFPRQLYDKIAMASVSTIPFRYLTTRYATEGAGFTLQKSGIKLDKKEEYITLLKKGSVFYVNSPEEKQKLINDLKGIVKPGSEENIPNTDELSKESKESGSFYQIGYNHAI